VLDKERERGNISRDKIPLILKVSAKFFRTCQSISIPT
jgi:hypothetical protein